MSYECGSLWAERRVRMSPFSGFCCTHNATFWVSLLWIKMPLVSSMLNNLILVELCLEKEIRSFLFMPPQYVMRAPVTKHVPLHNKSICKKLHVLLGGANNMCPLSWGGTNGKDLRNFHFVLYDLCDVSWFTF